ncbi:hypothetical protein [Novosphingobium clariflavum]|uniref:DUF4376 domain-containing protein n=1 Tax=Novosphingobium clariflavum TaxID=2029884 RepID=A0ABV6S1C0_9SPHN|nr:hypothetical protein [Novosphingobium clariflavum]
MTGLYIQFSDCGKHIRKWSRQRFDEANAYAYRTQPDGILPADEVEVAARAAARALGFDFDEVCGHETEEEACDSSTCIGGLNEEHHPADCREMMRKIARAVILAGPKARVDREAFTRLVVASRIVAFEDQGAEAIRELDQASEAFAAGIPWDDEPDQEDGDVLL